MKIALSGYYGFGNFGDEAILSAVRSVFFDCDVKVLGAGNRFNIRDLLSSDCLISGGGGLFQDKTSTKSFLYYAGIIFLAKLFKKPVYIIGQSIGPIKKSFNLNILKKIISIADLVILRDQPSFDFISSLSNFGRKVVKSYDLTFLLDYPTKEINDKMFDGKEFNIVIAPRAFKNMPKNYHKRIAYICDEIRIKTHAAIYLLPFQPKNDLSFCQLIADSASSRLNVVKSVDDFFSAINFISKME